MAASKLSKRVEIDPRVMTSRLRGRIASITDERSDFADGTKTQSKTCLVVATDFGRPGLLSVAVFASAVVFASVAVFAFFTSVVVFAFFARVVVFAFVTSVAAFVFFFSFVDCAFAGSCVDVLTISDPEDDDDISTTSGIDSILEGPAADVAVTVHSDPEDDDDISTTSGIDSILDGPAAHVAAVVQ